MLDELRKLRSGREYNPYALGHPTKALDLRSVLEALPRYPVTPGSPACPTALISEERLPTESSAEIIPKIPSVQLNSYAGGENTNASNDQSEPEGNRKSTKERSALQLKRARERARKKEKLDPARGREASRRVDFILKSLETAHGDFLLERAIHSQQGYVGVPDGGEDWRNFSNSKAARLRYLRDVGGYLLVDTSLDPRVDYPFIDANGHVWAVALAEPPGWEDRRAGIASARLHLSNRVAHLNVPFNRRGDFRSYQFGFSFGMGRTIPMNFKNSALVHEALVTFFDDPNVQSLFRFAEGGLRTWFPDHWDQFHEGIQAAQSRHPELRIPVPGTSFPASTVNVGDRVVCDSHRDASNEAAGICLDYVDGPFDADKGGHLVFHEARRIVKLRKGGVILFPSAIVTHENIEIGPTESRFSITGYVPGGVRRYLEAGGRTLKEWAACNPDAASAHEAEGASRWMAGCARFKTATELIHFWQMQFTEGDHAQAVGFDPSSQPTV